MSTTRFLLCCVLLAATEVASADLGMLKRTCGACHAPAEDTGKAPSFKAIAARYKNANGAEPQLLTAITLGSAGRWGKPAMPPTPRVSPLEARKLVQWVLDFE